MTEDQSLYYDTQLLIDIIENTEGVIFIGEQTNESGLTLKFYTGPSGKKVKIDISDDEIHSITAKSILLQLGLRDIATTIFPNDGLL